jgi:ribonuclease J
VEPIRVTHSIADGIGLAIETPLGTVVHTGDFKLDAHPVDHQQPDYSRFAALGERGVLVLCSDSTNVGRPGHTGSETLVGEALAGRFAEAPGRIIVVTFASHIHRIQQVLDLAARCHRNVALLGKSMMTNVAVAQELGYLTVPEGLIVPLEELAELPAQRQVIVSTGSQGEPHSAISLIATGEHKYVQAGPGDLVVFSSRVIPGNERVVGRVINALLRRGAEVLWEDVAFVHVSGHASQEDLKQMLALTRPRYFVPVHGEFRHLAEHKRIAERVTAGAARPVEVRLIENGDILRFDAEGAEVVGKAPTGRVLIDDTRVGEVADEVLRDRRHLAEDGIVLPIVAVRKQDGELARPPEIITRGVVTDASSDQLSVDAVRLLTDVIAALSVEERTDPGLLRETIRVELRRFFKRRSGRRPLVMPVVLEI